MYYDHLDTPLGCLLLACEAEGALRQVLFDDGRPGRGSDPGWTRRPGALSKVRRQLTEYFEGRRREFRLPLTPQGTTFQRRVWKELIKIPYGGTVSYGALARRIGKPKASRAVGAANGQNPISIIIPCHRVLGSTGQLTGYGGGLSRKQALLDLEHRFDTASRETCHRSPERPRSTAHRRSRSLGGEGLSWTLATRPPFDWEALVRFLAPRAIPGVEVVSREAYRRTIRIGGGHGAIRVAPIRGRPGLELDVRFEEPRGPLDVVERTRRLFDLDADPRAIRQHLGRDDRLRTLVAAHPGLRVPGAWDPAELAIRAVVGQQVTVAGATTLAGRLASTFGEPLTFDAGPGLRVVFPRPEILAGADLSRIGMPRARQETVRNVARACRENGVAGADASLDETVRAWTAIAGVGDWTAHYIAMRAGREPDAFPASDLGLRRAAGDGRTATARELAALAESWRPWRAYAAMHLWNSLGA